MTSQRSHASMHPQIIDPIRLPADLPIDAAAVGGKAANLIKMQRYGLSVPEFVVVPASLFACVCEEKSIADGIASALRLLGVEQPTDVSNSVCNLIKNHIASSDIMPYLGSLFNRLGAPAVAVRSSGTLEDGISHSFAGQFETFTGVRSDEEVCEAVLKCWLSAYSVNCLSYSLDRGLNVSLLSISCIVQVMIEPDVSGVLTTINPLDNDKSTMLVSSLYGLGEGLVSGMFDADLFRVSRDDETVQTLFVADKTRKLVTDHTKGGNTIVDVQDRVAALASLSVEQLVRLRNSGLIIERLFGLPQDIEFCINNDGLWIVQARPLTSNITGEVSSGRPVNWENSNISESFGSRTLPLTASFASYLYYKTFRGHAELLGYRCVEGGHLDRCLRNMLGYIDGQVYYNLENWYRMISLSPFYAVNCTAFEMSIGIDSSRRLDRPGPFMPGETISARLRRVLVGFRFWKLAFTVKSSIARFLGNVDNLLAVESKEELDSDPVSYHERTTELIDTFLSYWRYEIILEQTLSFTLGSVMMLTRRWLPQAPPAFLFEVAKPDGSIESMEPLNELSRIASRVSQCPDAMIIVRESEPAQLVGLLKASADACTSSIGVDCELYIRRFGFRARDELKLEASDLTDDPGLFAEQLISAVRVGSPSHSASRSPSDAQLYLDQNLSGPRRATYMFLVRRLRSLLALRERTRFRRTLVFGLARRRYKRLAVWLEQAGVICDRADIFYLRMDEVNDLVGSRSLIAEHCKTVKFRRDHLEMVVSLLPGSFRTSGIISTEIVQSIRERAQTEGSDMSILTELRGTPCSSGKSVGIVHVLEQPRDVAGGIMAAYRTDPGWCPALATASGLLVERGSPLTHVAMVARELGLPTIMQIPELTKRVRSGSSVSMDGGTGTLRVNIKV